jgi:hypothetical protein
MMRLALVFFILGMVSLVPSATTFAQVPLEVGRVLMLIFLGLSAISFVIGAAYSDRPKNMRGDNNRFI